MNAVEQAEIDIDDKADAQIGIHRTEEEIASYLTQFLKVVRPASSGDDVGGGEVVVRGKEVEKEVVVGVKRKAEEENGCSRTNACVKMHFCDELNCTYKTIRGEI